MTEKKTFKNPYHISHSSDWIEVYQIENTEIPSFIGNEDEWDMEVTFTKKEKPFRVNDQVIIKGGGELAVICHIIDEHAWVNVVATSSGNYRDSHHVVKLSELKHAS